MSVSDVQIWLGLLVLTIWLVLVFARGNFWRCLDRDDLDDPPAPGQWPGVVAVVPARDEASVIAASLGSLLAQNYPGEFHIVLVDDQSADGTARIARECAAGAGRAERLAIVSGAPLPQGWTGKVWAMAQGVRQARESFVPRYILFTDADIAHRPDNLRVVVARAEAGGYAMVSLMATWRCQSAAEKWMIPAFTYFFQMLYPFRWVSDARKKDAGAAGNCMLARADLLEKAGGIESIANALIDDCALGARMKSVGPIWLGLSQRLRSLRPYPRFADIRKMVSRSAYAQLRFSPLWLAGAVLGLALTFFAPVALAVSAPGAAGLCGIAAFVLMSVSFAPIQRFYGLPRWRALTLPLIAALYMVYTLDSALQYWRGRGGMWKGRAQAHVVHPAREARNTIETETS
ncbi:glycosyltransferase [Rhodoblastus sp. 17X3]|uniref:glycosyltransferase n=1 Tax=Rhodoblastus sp. 17X3 TaxID=3047026 RepID=UPI0024B73352|nr:glycosyltransferase [Rhodoblastus sp. 17X3]MDI9846826.1 glycosyltransferase [Rhodoblastus sp. 17X3]